MTQTSKKIESVYIKFSKFQFGQIQCTDSIDVK